MRHSTRLEPVCLHAARVGFLISLGQRLTQGVHDLQRTRYRLFASGIESFGPGEYMKKLAISLIAIGGLLSGCVAYEVPYRDGGAYQGRDRDRDGVPDRADRDRDGDGVRNRQDRRPDDSRRY